MVKTLSIVAVKGVVPTLEHPETRESLTVPVDRLSFSSTRLKDELVPEPYVTFNARFRSISKSSLQELFGEGRLEQQASLHQRHCMTLSLRPAH